MTRGRMNEVTLHLSDPRELFHPPEVEPFAGRGELESGIDRLVGELRGRPRGAVRARITLPASQITPDLGPRCREALQRYCRVRIAQLYDQDAGLWREGRATLGRGILFLAACMIGSRIFGEPTYLPAFLGRFIDEGFIIAGWVALWYPLDVLLYQHWPVNRDRRIYQAIEAMEIEFVAAAADR